MNLGGCGQEEAGGGGSSRFWGVGGGSHQWQPQCRGCGTRAPRQSTPVPEGRAEQSGPGPWSVAHQLSGSLGDVVLSPASPETSRVLGGQLGAHAVPATTGERLPVTVLTAENIPRSLPPYFQGNTKQSRDVGKNPDRFLLFF